MHAKLGGVPPCSFANHPVAICRSQVQFHGMTDKLVPRVCVVNWPCISRTYCNRVFSITVHRNFIILLPCIPLRTLIRINEKLKRSNFALDFYLIFITEFLEIVWNFRASGLLYSLSKIINSRTQLIVPLVCVPRYPG